MAEVIILAATKMTSELTSIRKGLTLGMNSHRNSEAMMPHTTPVIAEDVSTLPQVSPPVIRSKLFRSVPTIERFCTGNR
ncbi:hypothetical protein MAJHIDBO_00862 [Propionibacterium freudenreichii subsp. shermanii]|nr:hypothetical protein MAJHIDBO_00862 [Propionibacterium freudenreichii subsp. shermanii]SPS08665.1 hypothetical protein MAJHIDBO_00862 [Propionibacterium freudenreichii subsp. shermanii]